MCRVTHQQLQRSLCFTFWRQPGSLECRRSHICSLDRSGLSGSAQASLASRQAVVAKIAEQSLPYQRLFDIGRMVCMPIMPGRNESNGSSGTTSILRPSLSSSSHFQPSLSVVGSPLLHFPKHLQHRQSRRVWETQGCIPQQAVQARQMTAAYIVWAPAIASC